MSEHNYSSCVEVMYLDEQLEIKVGSSRKCYIFSILSVVVLAVLATVCYYYVSRKSQFRISPSSKLASTSIHTDQSILGNEDFLPTVTTIEKELHDVDLNFVYYTRQDWQELPTRGSSDIKRPIEYVIIAHTVTPRCSALIYCSKLLRSMQQNSMAYGLNDLGYNFAVDDDGAVYEVRGWNASLTDGISSSMYVSFIGNYEVDQLTELQTTGARKLLQYGVNMGLLDENYKLVAHSQVKNTLSPGKNAYQKIISWPHYVSGKQ